ncbi:stalk domain-containing protein [Bacillota bacterium LX-D]|nr:stalk domain-containing protein [Bacillota bacterium LX-D]
MKKFLFGTTAALVISSLCLPVTASTPLKLFFNGKASSINAVMINGSAYVPVRYVSENLGAKVTYINGTINITSKDAAATSGNVLTFSKDELSKMRILRVGEKLEINDLKYSVLALVHEQKKGVDYDKIIYCEETTGIVGNFGELPSFAIQINGKITKLTDYSFSAEQDTKDYKRVYSYSFPHKGEIQCIYYFVNGFQKSKTPIGRWIP